jgi:YidC/Oxa1 family membrane protein insertase
MPPATDDQSAQMQKMMTWMMPLMGLLFYRVPSGLCLYFIASSLWGIAERKMKSKTKDEAPNAAADRRRKKKDRPLIPARGSR